MNNSNSSSEAGKVRRDFQSAETETNVGASAARQLERIARELDEAGVSREVWIGTDSTADRVSWLIIRNKLNQHNSRSRHRALEAFIAASSKLLTDLDGRIRAASADGGRVPVFEGIGELHDALAPFMERVTNSSKESL